MWLKFFLESYNARCDAYINSMREIFKEIPQTIKKELTWRKKLQKLMTDIGGECYMEKSYK